MSAAPARRRSQRIDLSIPVRLSHGGQTVETPTLVVSRHGALVRCPFLISVGTRVSLENVASGEETSFKVAWVWPDEGENPGFKLGLEMIDDRVSFWGPRYERLTTPAVTD